jgi:hypothetical protein
LKIIIWHSITDKQCLIDVRISWPTAMLDLQKGTTMSGPEPEPIWKGACFCAWDARDSCSFSLSPSKLFLPERVVFGRVLLARLFASVLIPLYQLSKYPPSQSVSNVLRDGMEVCTFVDEVA